MWKIVTVSDKSDEKFWVSMTALHTILELNAKLLISFFQVHKLLYYVTHSLKVPFYIYNTPVQ
jgi:hypothetical protein